MNAIGSPYNGEDNDDYVNGQFCPKDIVGCTREFANEFAFLSLARQFCCYDGMPEAAQARAMARTRATSGSFKPNDEYEKMQFYYHPDHLGSSSYITNLDGEVAQHIEYVPFGEVFIEELEPWRKSATEGKANSNNTPTKKGSHSVIISGVSGSNTERAVTSGHEVFGHGIPSARRESDVNNNTNAIRTDNLIRRILGLPQGSDHAGGSNGGIVDPQKLPRTQ